MKKIIKGLVIVCLGLVISFSAFVIRYFWNDFRMKDDFSSLYAESDYQRDLYINDVGVISQKITCGYATIELLSKKYGKNVTEASLLKKNENKISTATGDGMEKELNHVFPELKVTRFSKIKSSEMLRKIYKSIDKGYPVPIQYSTIDTRKEEKNSALHFGLVVGISLKEDKINISNPFGYEEKLSIKEFVNATTFDNYKQMEFPIRMGMLIDMFTQNTIYILNSEI